MSRKRVKHLISPFDCIGKRVPKKDQQWTWCGRLRYHIEPNPKSGHVCKVCLRSYEKGKPSA